MEKILKKKKKISRNNITKNNITFDIVVNPIFSFSFDTRENFYLSRYKKFSFQYYLNIFIL